MNKRALKEELVDLRMHLANAEIYLRREKLKSMLALQVLLLRKNPLVGLNY